MEVQYQPGVGIPSHHPVLGWPTISKAPLAVDNEGDYQIVKLTEKDGAGMVDFMRRFFFKDEPLNVNVNLVESDGDRCVELEEYCLGCIADAIVSDTSDTSSESDVREYSPLSWSEASDSDATTDSSYIHSTTETTVIDVIVEEEVSWADNDTTASDSTQEDKEIPKADWWQCARCGCKKNNPVFRYCEKCFQRRKEEAVPRPQRRKQRCRKPNERFTSKSLLDVPSTSSSLASSSQETVTSVSSASSVDSGFLSQDSGPHITSHANTADTNMCNGCGSVPINAAFYHLRYAHMWGCYACSKRAWKPHKRCPICNGQSKVIKLLGHSCQTNQNF